MKGDNKFYCQNCKDLRDAEATSIIYYLPPYLIINLDYKKNEKCIPKKFEFGQVIDLTDFTDRRCKEKTYELIAVNSHVPNSENGCNFIAFCKNKNDNKWYKFNDSFVQECKFEEVNSYSPSFIIFKKYPI